MVALTALALVGVVSVEALAKKNKIIATVDGKRYKWKGRYVIGGISGNGTIIVAAKPGRTVRTIGFGCPIYPPTETFPLTPPAEFCNANYTEARYVGGVSTKGWLAVQGVNVTYDAFDGSRISGSFSAVLDGVTPNGLPPLTIEGTFNTAVTIQQ
jgi:hypothetical protein